MLNSINDVIENTDVLYMTEYKERLTDEDIDYEYLKNNLYLTQEMMTNKNNIVIMHPLPRNEELNCNIDNDPRAAY